MAKTEKKKKKDKKEKLVTIKSENKPVTDFAVSFSDGQHISKKYQIHAKDEQTAQEWAEKQREVWVKKFAKGDDGDLTDPTTWKVKVQAVG